ncbi:MAG TPA: alpha-ketoacid dehydrogenase subunit beta [Gammaproteobacteria bacterium]|nr:alpha-ketoacid dehydrogenase subunit beta [Gammaproteobacteria bacterium]
MAKVTLIDAVNMAMAHELEHDDSVVVFGEDVGPNGGVFRATTGLQERFGKERVFDTPLAESMIAGLAVGMSAQGMKPVGEIQFSGFAYPAFDQLISHAARMRHRTRGRLHCPMVIRAPSGGGIHAPEHHSESMEAIYAHTPGLRVVMPSSPARAYGLLLASIRDPDPVVFLEPKRIYRLVKQEVPDDGEALPLDTCFVLREGEDVTMVTWGAMVHETLKAAEALAKEGVSCEVIDLATISPIDYETILESVEKTGRLVVVHEAPRNAGVGAEIAAEVAEKAIYSLLAPIQRVTGYDTVMPLFRREMDYLPSTARVAAAVKKTLED